MTALSRMLRGLKEIFAGKTGSGNSYQIFAGRFLLPSVTLLDIQMPFWKAPSALVLFCTDEAAASPLKLVKLSSFIDAVVVGGFMCE